MSLCPPLCLWRRDRCSCLTSEASTGRIDSLPSLSLLPPSIVFSLYFFNRLAMAAPFFPLRRAVGVESALGGWVRCLLSPGPCCPCCRRERRVEHHAARQQVRIDWASKYPARGGRSLTARNAELHTRACKADVSALRFRYELGSTVDITDPALAVCRTVQGRQMARAIAQAPPGSLVQILLSRDSGTRMISVRVGQKGLGAELRKSPIFSSCPTSDVSAATLPFWIIVY